MKLFSKSKRAAAATAQLRSNQKHPFGVLDRYVPLGGGDARLYRAIREAIPIVDAAVLKLIRLTGGFRIETGSKALDADIAEFLRTVNTGRGQQGINSFLDCYLDSMITCGRAVGEIVLRGRREIAAVICGNVEDVQILEGDTPLDFQLCAAGEGGIEPLPWQELLLFTPWCPEANSPYGVSMLRSMPFLAEILLKIYNSIGVNWERVGNLRYAVLMKPGTDALERAYASERAEALAAEWSRSMQAGKDGDIRDFVAVGDVDIRVIGADNQVLDSEVPVRQILEQLIARTGIPPFMLGLSWASTERMSAQQADLMTSEITAIRRTLTPVVERIVSLYLALRGIGEGFRVVWDDINLQDEVEEAKAALYLAQAEKIKKEDANGNQNDEGRLS